MSPPKPTEFLIVQTRPRLEDFPKNLDAYILVQPKALEAPVELYYLSKNVDLLVLITQENIGTLLAKIQSPVIDFDYSGITGINDLQEKIIEAETHFSISDAEKMARQEILVNDIVKNRVKSGILANNLGKPIKLQEHSSLVFHCNIFSDGIGDQGNVIDVARHIIEYTQNDTIHFYFVVTATQAGLSNDDPFDTCYSHFLAEISNLFSKYQDISFSPEENIYSFRIDHMPSEHMRGLNAKSSSYNALINNNPKLRKIYANAEAIFNIATPFPALPKSIQLKPSTQIINITEHNASAQWFANHSIPEAHHYVTGFGKGKSGLMIEDLSCDLDESVKALQSIEKEYISKLGLSFPVSTKEAAQFLKNTLVVPVYLGVMQQTILAQLVYMVSQSPLASGYGNIVFHINQRAYNSEIFNKQFKELENTYGPSPGKIQLIVGHFFKDEVDFRRLYQLSSGAGVAIISSDKVLELAISNGLFPIYPPVPWKEDVYKDLCKLVQDDVDCTRLFSHLGSIENKQLSGLASLVNSELLNNWAKMVRPELLKNSFYGILQARILGQNSLVEKKIPNPAGLFSQHPLDKIASQTQKLFSTQLSALMMKPNQTLQFMVGAVPNKKFETVLNNCDAQTSLVKNQIEIQGSKNIQQFLMDLGFKDAVLEKLCRELKLDFQKPASSEENNCILM